MDQQMKCFQDHGGNNNNNNNNHNEDGDDHVEDGPLPGFRFHPTDEELVSFYLKRKVEKRPIRIELIKQVDIYKHDPWDLSKFASVGDNKELYFYCKRGRKYRNSIRPNRVTGSGFWKATGIDRPIYNNEGEGHRCIGLKKSLVYYRGSAGKGTKTDWMMHEFRLPIDSGHQQYPTNKLSCKVDIAQEAEIWTLCRIFKRSKKYTPDWRELSAAKKNHHHMSSSKTCSTAESNNDQGYYISFSNTAGTSENNYHSSPQLLDNNPVLATTTTTIHHHQLKDSSSVSGFMDEDQKRSDVMHWNSTSTVGSNHHMQWGTGGSSSTSMIAPQTPPSDPSNNSTSSLNVGLGMVTDDHLNHLLAFGSWDDLSSVVGFAVGTTPLL